MGRCGEIWGDGAPRTSHRSDHIARLACGCGCAAPHARAVYSRGVQRGLRRRGSAARRVGAAAFEAMKESAVFISLGRGDVVDEAALVAALSRGRICGAALDVFEQANPLTHHAHWALHVQCRASSCLFLRRRVARAPFVRPSVCAAHGVARATRHTHARTHKHGASCGERTATTGHARSSQRGSGGDPPSQPELGMHGVVDGQSCK